MAARSNPSEPPFFHGKLTRQEAEGILMANYQEGLYLIRVSTSAPGEYVLSLCTGRQSLHFQIKHQGECWFSIDDGPLFEGLAAVVQHYSSTSDGLPTTLRDCCPKQLRRRNEADGSTPLHQACQKGNAPALKQLLVKAGDINLRNRCGRTPLHEAVRAGSEACVAALLEPRKGQPIDINAPDDQQWTSLHYAASQGLDNIVRMLIVSGAAPHCRTVDMETPRDIASRMAFAEACKLLGHAESGICTEAELAKRDYPWFHGKIGRKPAEHIIAKHGSGEGLFLVRESSSVAGDYVLTMSSNGQPFHFQIQAYDKNCFFIDDGPIFEGLSKIIEYYRTTPDGLPTQLRQYCRRLASARHSEPQVLAPSAAGNPIQRDAQKLSARPPRARSDSVAASKKDPYADSDDDDDAFDYDRMSSSQIQKIAEKKRRQQKPQADLGMPSMIPLEQIELGAELGTGEFGSVLAGIWNQPGGGRVQVAVKTLRKESIGQGEPEFLREANVMLKLQHPYVVRLLGICLSQPMMIVQELVPLGSLLSYLPKHRTELLQTKEYLILYASQIAAGMNYLEAQRFVHRDLATRNILVLNPSTVKISDFGLSRAIGSDDNYYKASAGGKWPVKWYAPESVYFGKFTHKSDVWSFGVTLWEIWSFGDLPYDEMTGREVLEMLDRGQRLGKPAGCSDAIYRIMRSCWEYNADERASFRALLRDLKSLLPSAWQQHLQDA